MWVANDSGLLAYSNSGWSSSASVYIQGHAGTGGTVSSLTTGFSNWTPSRGAVAISAANGKGVMLGVHGSSSNIDAVMEVTGTHIDLNQPLMMPEINNYSSEQSGETGVQSTNMADGYVYSASNMDVGTPLQLKAKDIAGTVYVVLQALDSSAVGIDAVLMEALTGGSSAQEKAVFMGSNAVSMKVSLTQGGSAVAADTTLAFSDGDTCEMYMDTTTGCVSKAAPTSGDVFLAGKAMIGTTDSNGKIPVVWYGQRILSL